MYNCCLRGKSVDAYDRGTSPTLLSCLQYTIMIWDEMRTKNYFIIKHLQQSAMLDLSRQLTPQFQSVRCALPSLHQTVVVALEQTFVLHDGVDVHAVVRCRELVIRRHDRQHGQHHDRVHDWLHVTVSVSPEILIVLTFMSFIYPTHP